MKINTANWDRIVRIVLGIVLVYFGFIGGWGWIWGVVGLIPLITGAIGFCPIYALIKVGTKK